MNRIELWGKGIVAAAIAGGANGVITGFAAVGIDPLHFNLQSGLHSTIAVAAASATMSAMIGVAAYLKQSPLPSPLPFEEMPAERGRDGEREGGRDAEREDVRQGEHGGEREHLPGRE
jgi:hypothetical protein